MRYGFQISVITVLLAIGTIAAKVGAEIQRSLDRVNQSNQELIQELASVNASFSQMKQEVNLIVQAQNAPKTNQLQQIISNQPMLPTFTTK